MIFYAGVQNTKPADETLCSARFISTQRNTSNWIGTCVFLKFKMSYTLLLRKKRLYCSCIPVALFKMVYKPEYSWPQYMGHHPEQHFNFANPAQLPWWGPCESSVRLTEYSQGVKENKLKAKLMLDQLRQSSNSWYMWEKWYSKITKQLQAFESYWKR